MSTVYIDGVKFEAGNPEAFDILYDNSLSGLTATRVQTAIDEVDSVLDTAKGNISTLNSQVTTLNNDVSTNGSVLKTVKDNAQNATYTNTASLLTSTTIKTAINEVEKNRTYLSHGTVVMPNFTDNGNGSITVDNTGVFTLFNNDTGVDGSIKQYAINGGTFTMVDGLPNYLYVFYRDQSQFQDIPKKPRSNKMKNIIGDLQVNED